MSLSFVVTTIKNFIRNCVLVAIVFLLLFPLLVTVTNSFMSNDEIAIHYRTLRTFFDSKAGMQYKFADMQLVPERITVSQYKQVLLNQPIYLSLLLNSMKIALPVVIGNTLVSFFCAYGFTVWKWRFKEQLFLLYIIVMLMPMQAVLVPNYLIAEKLHVTNSYLAIILPGIFSPFGTFLLRQSMKVLPVDYFEAAQIDGAGHIRVVLSIVIPQMKAGLAALTILVFIEYWNIIDQSIVFIKEYFREPMSVYLSRMTSANADIVLAASCVYMIFPIWLLVTGQDGLEHGIEMSGIK